MIDRHAVIDPQARLAPDVSVGPFSVVGPGVEIGEGSWIGPHVVIRGPTVIGKGNKIYQFASIGEDPQDKKFQPSDVTRLTIGDHNTIREYVTINRGTAQDLGETRIGDHNWIMATAHIAHDCVVGSNTIFANGSTLAGHVTIEDWAILGGYTLVHQFCRVGAHAFTAGGAVVLRDVLPYVISEGQPARPRGINSEGLKRRNFSEADIDAIKAAYRVVYRSGKVLADVKQELAELGRSSAPVQRMLEFIESSKRALQR